MKSRKSLAAAFTLAACGLIVIVGVVSTNVSAQEKSEKIDKNLARQAKITLEKARAIARKKATGKIEGEELEKEHGKLVYSFDIRNAKGTIDEVQVSAINGKVVRVEHENKKQEAAEKRKEHQKKSRQP